MVFVHSASGIFFVDIVVVFGYIRLVGRMQFADTHLSFVSEAILLAHGPRFLAISLEL